MLDIDGDQKLSKVEFLQLMERDPDLHHVCIKACRCSAPVPRERRCLRSGSLLASRMIATTAGWTLVELITESQDGKGFEHIEPKLTNLTLQEASKITHACTSLCGGT